MPNKKLPLVGLGKFTSEAIALSNKDFKKAMLLRNDDESIENIKMVRQPMDVYDRS
jgi:hypothetical protein